MILDKRATDTELDVACCNMASSPEWQESARLQVHTTRFGKLETDEGLVITIADGLIGFENCRRFVVVRPSETSAFRWLQSLDEPAMAFPIVEPVEFRPDYAPTIADSDAQALELRPEIPTLLFVIVTVPAHNPRAITANLLGPIVINALTRRGKQVIIQDDGYSTRHSIVDELMRMAAIRTASAASRIPDADIPVGKGDSGKGRNSFRAA